MSVADLFNIFKDTKYDLFFLCLEKENTFYRYKTNRVKTLKDLKDLFENSSLRRFESGVNSDEINVFDCTYIDCYYKNYPK